MSTQTQGQAEGQMQDRPARMADGPAPDLATSAKKLTKFGGYEVLEQAIKGLNNLNPEKKALRNIFLQEDERADDRKALQAAIDLWMQALQADAPVSQLVTDARTKVDEASQLYNENVKKALDATRTLEQAYRSVDSFFKNAEQSKAKDITFMNASPQQVQDMASEEYVKAVEEELQHNYDRFDLSQAYSMLVVPGYMGKDSVLKRWGQMAYKNKVMMLTDFMDLDDPDSLMAVFESRGHTGDDAFRSSVMMACNYPVGRGKNATVGEEEDVTTSPAAALAGRIYYTDMKQGVGMAQPVAGERHGMLNGIDGVKMDLRKGTTSEMERLGLVPLVKEAKTGARAMSAKTLCTADNLGLQTYSVKRTYDYIMKVLIDYLNKYAFVNWTGDVKRELRGQIEKFLDRNTGHGRLIEKFTLARLDQDPNQKDRIFLDLHITPFFPAKSFVITMDGMKGDDFDQMKWETEIKQN